MFKTETHLHTLEVSPCGKISAEDMVKLYHEQGYSTVCISDHVKQEYFDKMGDISWKKKVDAVLRGCYKAKKVAKKYGVKVITSAELLLEKSRPNHYLIYGNTKKFLYNYPNCCKMGIEEFYKIANENGILVIQAHPFRDDKNNPTPNFVHGFEIFNSNPRHEDYNEKAKTTAIDNGLFMVAGSDAHRLEDVAKSGIATEKIIKTSKDLIKVIKSGKFEIIGDKNV